MRGYFRINDNVGVETTESSLLQDVIKELTYIRGVLGGETCGKCQSGNIVPHCREVTSDGETNEFFELKCLDCQAFLQLGQNKNDKKTLYKKKLDTNRKGKANKTDEGKAIPLPNQGWLRYNPATKENE